MTVPNMSKRAAELPPEVPGEALPGPAAGLPSEPAAAPSATPSAAPAPGAWGAGLGYPDWFEAIGGQVHQFFNWGNKYFMVPGLRMGLGRYMSTPFTGYLFILRTRGRTSGVMRDAPLGYYARGEFVYCMAGFGRETHWFRNVLADPRVEAILPGRSFSGIAEEVTDPEERTEILVPLVRSMGPVVVATGLGNPWREDPATILERLAAFPLVRIRQTGFAPGPDDPGGWGWIVPMAAGAGWLLRRTISRRRRARASAPCACSGKRGK